MNTFQYLVVALILMLSLATVRSAAVGGIRKRIAIFWLMVWAGAGALALFPQGTVLVARALGIGRGADLVLYCTAFATLIGFFYIYVRFRRLDRTLTVLVRQIAIERALDSESQRDHAGLGDGR
jgi:hypothetical protein